MYDGLLTICGLLWIASYHLWLDLLVQKVAGEFIFPDILAHNSMWVWYRYLHNMLYT